MNMTVFMFINILAGIVLLFLLARFTWNMWFSTAYYPVEWTRAEREHKISPTLKRLSRRYPDKARFFAWWLQVDRLEKERIPGDFAEVGVYKGDSAAAIHHMDRQRRFH